jgi:hypothetical protein
VSTGEEYLEKVQERLTRDDCTVTKEPIGPVEALVGYRSNFIPLAMSKLHLFAVVASVAEVNEAAIRDFALSVLQHAKESKGAMRGMQSGVIAFAALVAPIVDDAAKQLTTRPFKVGLKGFAAMVRPAVIDLTESKVHTFRGRRFVGWAFNGYIRRKSVLYLPDPA